MPSIGVALGGGGARGFAHIGVLRVLEDNNIPINEIAGTSMGAAIGGLYSAGIRIEELEKMAETLEWNKITDISPSNIAGLLLVNELLDTRNFESYLKKIVGDKKIDELKIKFKAVSCDLKTGEPIVFKEGSLVDAIRASSSIPGVFKPLEYKHRYLVDGGIVSNLPVEYLESEFKIAVLCPANFSVYPVKTALQILTQAIYIQGEYIQQNSIKSADFLFSPATEDIMAYELYKYREAVVAGRIEAERRITELKKKIINMMLR